MAAAAVQHAPGLSFKLEVESDLPNVRLAEHDVATELYYYQDPGDGSPPTPSYVG